MDTPLVKKAQEKGIEVIAEIELAFRNYAGHMVAITGTNGKTTTTTLVGEMLKTLPVKTAVGGNIGRALSAEIKDLDKDSWVAAEVSSYQLEGIQSFRPQIAAVLNLTPDHLTRHKTMEEYGRCKQNIFINQQDQDVTILNYDDPEVRTWGGKSRGQLCYFSRNTVLPQGVYMKDGSFILQWGNTKAEICHKDELQIFGAHNEENVLAAIAVSYTHLDVYKRQVLLQVEQEMGRKRLRHWGERNIDLDLLLYEDRIINLPQLQLPHPDLQNRSFVLQPLAQIAPEMWHPVLKKTIGELWQNWQAKHR